MTATRPYPLETRHAARHLRSARLWAETLAECRGNARAALASLALGETFARAICADDPDTIHAAFRCGLAPAGGIGWG